MYKQYYNAYEKKAEEIRRAARSIEKGDALSSAWGAEAVPAKTVLPVQAKIFSRFSTDDILLCALIFLLVSAEEKDTTLILILAYLFITGLK